MVSKGKKKVDFSVNKARYASFLKSYKIKDVNEPFSKKNLKKFDASTIPPCESELFQHFLRSYFIAKIWINADKKIPLQLENSDEDDEDLEPVVLKPTDFGWIINENDQYEFKWFAGNQLPETVKDVLDESEGELKRLYSFLTLLIYIAWLNYLL